MTSALYHHTDTCRLPNILLSRELRPGRNLIGGFPDPDFLWATTEPAGDATASAHRGDHYRTGKIWAVRFELDAADFMPWSDVLDRFPQWTRDQISRLENIRVGGQAKPETWFCRVDPLPLTKVKKIEVRSYANKNWRALPDDISVTRIAGFLEGGPDGYGIEMFGRRFASRRYPGRPGTGRGDGYELL